MARRGRASLALTALCVTILWSAACDRKTAPAPPPVSEPDAAPPAASAPGKTPSGAARIPASGVPQYRDITAEAGIDFIHVRGSKEKDYIVETKGGGLALFDYDGDGRADLYLVNGSTFDDLARGTGPEKGFFRNEGGLRFRRVGREAGIADRTWGIGCVAGDYDGDGDIDLYVTNWGANRLYRNEGDGTFTDVTAEAGVGDDGFGAAALFVDMDRDGFLDLYVVNYLQFEREKTPCRGEVKSCHIRGIPTLVGPVGLPKRNDVFYRNRGDGTFEDLSEAWGFRKVKEIGYGLGAIAGDVNRDGWPDIFVSNDTTPNFLFLNQGGGRVKEVAFFWACGVNEAGNLQAGMGIDMGDIRCVGVEDIILTTYEADTSTLFKNSGKSFFNDETSARGLATVTFPHVGWAALFIDVDMDRDLDLALGNGHVVPQADLVQGTKGYRQRNQLLLNDGTGRFREVTDDAGPGFEVRATTRGTACADLDGDGDCELAANNLDGPATLLEAVGPPKAHWLGVRLASRRGNRFGEGSWIGLVDGEGRQLRYLRSERSWGSTSEPVARFGLGDVTEVRELLVLWLGGGCERFPVAGVDRVLLAVEGRGQPGTWPFWTP
ncbi:MAG: CRTAC1 family protein [Planctomycetes bacterium]|nr:CRTAC1 family protein [Planctomycetota bacterium]